MHDLDAYYPAIRLRHLLLAQPLHLFHVLLLQGRSGIVGRVGRFRRLIRDAFDDDFRLAALIQASLAAETVGE